MKLPARWFLISLGLVFLSLGVVRGKRAGGLLQPSGGGDSDSSRPSDTLPTRYPSRGPGSGSSSGSGQHLLQPFDGNIFNSHSSTGSSSGSPSHGASLPDHTIHFPGSGSSSGGSRATRRPPPSVFGSSPINPVGSGNTLNSGQPSTFGSANSSPGGGSSSSSGNTYPSSVGGSSSSSSSSGGLSSQTHPSGGSEDGKVGGVKDKLSTPTSPPKQQTDDVKLNVGGGIGPLGSSSKRGGNQAQTLRASKMVTWCALIPPLMTTLMMTVYACQW